MKVKTITVLVQFDSCLFLLSTRHIKDNFEHY